MEWTLEKLKQQKEIVDSQKYNNPKIYEEVEIYNVYSVFSELLDNMINLQEGN